MSNDTLKIAVCLVGFVRTLPLTFFNLKTQFGTRGSAAAKKDRSVAFDLFGVVANDMENDTAKGQWHSVSHASVATAIETLQPVDWSEAVLPESVPRACSAAPCMRQYERLERCGDMLDVQERSCGRRYDWVVKARPDIKVVGSVAFRNLSKNTVYLSRKSVDLLMLIPRGAFNAFARNLGSLTYVPYTRHVRSARPASCWGLPDHARCTGILYAALDALHLHRGWHSFDPILLRTRDASIANSWVQNIPNGTEYFVRSMHNMEQDDERLREVAEHVHSEHVERLEKVRQRRSNVSAWVWV